MVFFSRKVCKCIYASVCKFFAKGNNRSLLTHTWQASDDYKLDALTTLPCCPVVSYKLSCIHQTPLTRNIIQPILHSAINESKWYKQIMEYFIKSLPDRRNSQSPTITVPSRLYNIITTIADNQLKLNDPLKQIEFEPFKGIEDLPWNQWSTNIWNKRHTINLGHEVWKWSDLLSAENYLC